MITIRRLNSSTDRKKLKKILSKNNFDDKKEENEVIYLIEENNEVLGVSKLTIWDNIGILKYLIIDKNIRGNNLGDGLLRATLNYCYLNGINKVYYLESDNYLLKKGFEKIDIIDAEDNIKRLINKKTALVCDVPVFFENTCNNGRG
ncbi:GNAT family N-acetyltransferase [Thermohalobacter berrensis]|uniref:N-acetyltransferase domain-containing protein n=1 Tax=Thermohalobacter berrensis TaxID=99594 RepID=A0A419TAM6_9FIRM|nr:GNAT family N-acetyltransferase [Thermohalobacter berrensis]RKD34536.1 hypothetical protein BET03_01530 [Thermohalobacter berrensis]